ncbi:uncharacterized protein, partial [Fopius arisanus]|uniref:Methyltransferase type 11 domain-containing protein n=1 Tax=Fopius arisanus TaxID=64838 RepID=A0A9R1TPQ3_9HYME
MVEYGQQHYGVEGKLSFVQLDMQTPKLPESLIGQFDNVVSFYALHWCRNTRQALTNIYKLLRPGGKAIFMTITHHVIYDVYLEQEKDPRFSPYMQNSIEWTPPHQGCPDAEEKIRDDLIATKFKIQYCANKSEKFTYPTFDTLV